VESSSAALRIQVNLKETFRVSKKPSKAEVIEEPQFLGKNFTHIIFINVSEDAN